MDPFPPQSKPADGWTRAAALAVDAAIVVSAEGMAMMAAVYAVAPWGGSVSMPLWPYSLLLEGALLVLALAAAWRWKRSPGMAAMGLDLVDSATGQRPSLLRCLARAFPVVGTAAVGCWFAMLLMLGAAPDANPGRSYLRLLGLAAAILALALLPYLPLAFGGPQSLWDWLTRTAVSQRPQDIHTTRSTPPAR